MLETEIYIGAFAMPLTSPSSSQDLIGSSTVNTLSSPTAPIRLNCARLRGGEKNRCQARVRERIHGQPYFGTALAITPKAGR